MNKRAAECSVYSKNLVIEIPETGHWWWRASGAQPAFQGTFR